MITFVTNVIFFMLFKIPTSRNGAPYESNKFLGNGFAAEEPSTGRHLTIPQKTPLGGHHVAKSNAQTNDEVPLTSMFLSDWM